ncbi:MAG: oxygen-independent coproporphyrinogen III oxidase [Cyanobacteria bacterium]|nr:oxygen-independent coproporphyrinogen III oxidase [Cyanobacteriota bacterium]
MTRLSETTILFEGLNEDLLNRYNTNGPRYTSYPTAPEWRNEFGAAQMKEAVSIPASHLPISLYTHLPFCESRCLFCSCNVVITRNHDQADPYVDAVIQEMRHTRSFMDASRPVKQFHWGGGTPTFLSIAQMERLFKAQTQELFKLAPDAEVAVEVDPRVTTAEQIKAMREWGFNRISLGVQDFEALVQETIHRVQPVSMTEAMVNQCRELGFEGINFDLIYGLPHQTVATFETTLTEVLRLSPDRIALYNFAFVPWMSPHQRHIPEDSLPSGPQKFQIFRLALSMLSDAGYEYIGMDHFAKPSDELAVARREKSLHRNFMGYTTKAGCELYGFGVSAISGLNRHYGQNWRQISEYYAAVQGGEFATMRGLALSDDDVYRRSVILQILCQGTLTGEDLAKFPEAMPLLESMKHDGLLSYLDSATGFELTPLGRVFSRNIAMLFDAYLKASPEQSQASPVFSKTL